MSSRPIGIFDSGVGGLTVAREIRRALPSETLLYVADAAYCPYGDRPADQVRARALAVGCYLDHAGAKLLVTACNTATGAALESLRDAVKVEVIGLEPAVKTGAALSRNRRIGVMATAGTLRSERFARLVKSFAHGATVVAQPCPGLADIIEEGHLEGAVLERLLETFVRPLREAGVDTVVLGCTHYAFVAEPLARMLGPGVSIVDSAPAIARRAEHLLRVDGRAESSGQGRLSVLTTGEPEPMARMVRRLWPEPAEVRAVQI